MPLDARDRSATDPEEKHKAAAPAVADYVVHPARRSKVTGHPHRSVIPTAVGIVVALAILLVSAGATIFFLTKPGDDELLFRDGQKQLANGQYAFAVKTLERVAALRPSDARVYLALARAYVGIDQVDRAWECISHAQQLGAGVVAERQLASELAKYYRQHGNHDRAIELLRPLAQANLPGKKAELADLCASWGDEAIRDGDLDRALRCWEEVRALREGTRYLEADARLATIYQKMVAKFTSKGDDRQALAYLAKLNLIAENASNYERAAEIYQRLGQLDLAIDQLRRASKLPNQNPSLDKRLAALMAMRGKELLDLGDTAAGYGYLQQARSLDPVNVVPAVALRSVNVSVDPLSSLPRLVAEIWNPGSEPVKFLTLKVELWSSVAQKVLWEREQKVIDEFVPPLNPQESKPFDVMAAHPVKEDGKTEFRVYLDGGLYKTYSIGGRKAATDQPAAKPVWEPKGQTRPETPLPAPPAVPASPQTSPPSAPPIPAQTRGTSPAAPAESIEERQPEHPESQTLKDLEL